MNDGTNEYNLRFENMDKQNQLFEAKRQRDQARRERDQLQHDLDDAEAEIKRLRLVLHGIANPGLFTTFSSEEIARKALEYKEEK